MVKISILGASGTIGKNVAFTLAQEDKIDEIVMYSRPSSAQKVKGEILDMDDALAAKNRDSVLVSSSDIKDIEDSDIVLITSGISREKGMNRLDLAIPNAKIVSNYSKQIAKYAPDSIILIITNPVDVMTAISLEASGFDKFKVIGLGNHLDSLRLKNILSKYFNINSGEVHTRVIGEHGDHMVPLLSYTTIGGILLRNFENSENICVDDLVKKVRTSANTIIANKGATEYGPAYAISNLVSTIVNDSHKILTVSTYLEGEIEGVSNVSLGVPVILCKEGIKNIVPIEMNDYERVEFLEAAKTVKKCTTKVKEKLNSIKS